MRVCAHILLVEDDAAARRSLAAYLAAQGYRVIECGDCATALAILESDDPVDLVLADIGLPEPHGGLAFGRAARQRRPGVKVLHTTAAAEPLRDHAALVRRGALVRLPPDCGELVRQVGDLLGRWAVDQNEILHAAYAYWLDQLAGRPLPDRRDLDPAAIKEILPYLSIFELVGAGAALNFRCRLVGTRIAAALGCNAANRLITEGMSATYAPFMVGLMRGIVERREPLYAASAFKAAENGLSTERLFLPFTAGGATLSQIVLVQTFDWRNRASTLHELSRFPLERRDRIERPPAAPAYS